MRIDPGLRGGRVAGLVALVALALTGGAVVAAARDDGRSASVVVSETIPAPTTPATVPLASSTGTATTVPPTTTPPTTTPTTTTTPPTTVPATTAPPATIPQETLPSQPIAPPSDPRAFEESTLLGRIAIPSLGVDEELRSGIRLSTIDLGPGHWPGTAMPGEVGNVVVAAHRTSHGAPFRYIDTLNAGDEVIFDTDQGRSTYQVTSTEVVEPTALWIVDPTDTPTATLFACHPPGSVSQRIVVHLELAP